MKTFRFHTQVEHLQCGHVDIEAETLEEAEEKFWELDHWDGGDVEWGDIETDYSGTDIVDIEEGE